MILVILTSDYEIFGNGSGDIDYCLIKPTEELLNICSKHEVPVTLFADIAEYWAFEEEEKKKTLPEGYLPATKIRNQLIKAVQSGHDVQLHLHPQWLNYSYDAEKGWQVDVNMWRLPSLPYGDYNNRKSILGALHHAKKTLEDMLAPFKEDYNCIAFRAGGWCIQPELQVLKALKQIGIRIDSTVAPGLFRNDGLTMYDFRELLNLSRERAYWYIGETFDGTSSKDDDLIEVPILTVPFYLHQRVISRMKSKRLGLNSPPFSCSGEVLSGEQKEKQVKSFNLISVILKKLKRQIMVDFTSLTADDMYASIKKAIKMYPGRLEKIPVVFISHSKVLGEENLRELEKFIVKAKKLGVSFGKYEDFLAWEDGKRDITH